MTNQNPEDEFSIANDIWHLKRLAFFPELSVEQIDAMAKSSRIRKFAKGDMVYFPGELANHVYLIREGFIRLSRVTPEGRSLTLDILQAPDIFGEMAVAGQERRSEVAEAMQPCVLWAIALPTLVQLVESDPRIALQITKIIGFRRTQIENKVSTLLSTVPVRLARLVLTLADRYPASTKLGRRAVKLRLTHREIGDLIASNREIVTATLNKMKKDKLIDFLQNRIVLTDEIRLREMAGTDKGEV